MLIQQNSHAVNKHSGLQLRRFKMRHKICSVKAFETKKRQKEEAIHIEETQGLVTERLKC